MVGTKTTYNGVQGRSYWDVLNLVEERTSRVRFTRWQRDADGLFRGWMQSRESIVFTDSGTQETFISDTAQPGDPPVIIKTGPPHSWSRQQRTAEWHTAKFQHAGGTVRRWKLQGGSSGFSNFGEIVIELRRHSATKWAVTVRTTRHTIDVDVPLTTRSVQRGFVRVAGGH